MPRNRRARPTPVLPLARSLPLARDGRYGASSRGSGTSERSSGGNCSHSGRSSHTHVAASAQPGWVRQGSSTPVLNSRRWTSRSSNGPAPIQPSRSGSLVASAISTLSMPRESGPHRRPLGRLSRRGSTGGTPAALAGFQHSTPRTLAGRQAAAAVPRPRVAATFHRHSLQDAARAFAGWTATNTPMPVSALLRATLPNRVRTDEEHDEQRVSSDIA